MAWCVVLSVRAVNVRLSGFGRTRQDNRGIVVSTVLASAGGAAVVTAGPRYGIALACAIAVAIAATSSSRGSRLLFSAVLLIGLAPDAPAIAHVATFNIVPRTVAYVALLAVIVAQSLSGTLMLRLRYCAAWGCLFVLVTAGAWSAHRPQAVPEFLFFLGLPYFVGCTLASNARAAASAIRALVMSALTMVVEAVIEVVRHKDLFPSLLLPGKSFTRAGNVQATAGWSHPLALGMFLCTVAFLVIDSYSARRRVRGVIAGMFVAVGIFATEERSALLGFLVGALAFFLLQPTAKRRWRALFSLVGMIAVLFYVPIPGAEHFRRFLSASTTSGSAAGVDVSGRYELFHLALGAVHAHPLFGFSYGVIENTVAAASLASRLSYHSVLYSDVANFPLGMAIELGLGGLLCLALVLGLTIRRLIRARSTPNTPNVGLAAGLIGGIVASLGTSNQSSAMALMFVAGIGACVGREPTDVRTESGIAVATLRRTGSSLAQIQRSRWRPLALYERAPKVVWALGDQAMSSGTNAAFQVLVARSVPPAQFGYFSLLFVTYLLALGVSQAVGGSTLMIRFGAGSRHAARREVGACLSIAVTIGLVGSFAAIAIGYAADRSWSLIAVFAASLPFLLMQAVWRWQFYVEGVQERAALTDLIWLCVQGAFYAVVVGLLGSSPALLAAGWGAGAAVSATYCSIVHGIWPSPKGMLSFLRTHRALISRLGSEYVVLQCGNYLLPYALVGLIGFAGLGYIRAGQLLIGVVGVALSGLSPLFVKRAAVTQATSPREIVRHASRVAIVGMALVLLWTGIVMLVPSQIGTAVVGSEWLGVRQLLAALGAASAVQWVVWSAVNALHVRSDVRLTLRIAILNAFASAIAVLSLAKVGGTVAAAWGMVLGPACTLPVAWVLLLKAVGSDPVQSVVCDRSGWASAESEEVRV